MDIADNIFIKDAAKVLEFDKEICVPEEGPSNKHQANSRQIPAFDGVAGEFYDTVKDIINVGMA